MNTHTVKMDTSKSIGSRVNHSGMMMNDFNNNSKSSDSSSFIKGGGGLDDDLKGIPSFILKLQETQPTLNIMTCGDVSHGKSTLLAALSGEKTGKHSKEKQGNMTIRLGYTSCKIWKCLLCPRPECYFSTHSDLKLSKIICPNCGTRKLNKNGADTKQIILIRHLSFVDVPGHAHLMQTMVSATCVSDSAILVIDSSSKLCPGKQTEQHCSAINLLGLMKEKQIIVAQNKIDLINHSSACLNYENIREYLSIFSYNLSYNTPIIPISAQSKLNIDALCHSIIRDLPKYSTKLCDEKKLSTEHLRMNIIRSFDVNRAKQIKTMKDINGITGGVIGGAVLSGYCKIGQLIEIRPGYIKKKEKKEYKNEILNKLQPQWEAQPIVTRIISLKYGKNKANVAYPGGNVGIQTNIDPSLSKSDRMCGHIVIDANNMNPPPIFSQFIMSYCFIEKQNDFRIFEQIRINIGSMKMKGEVIKRGIGDYNGILVVLEAPICANIGDPVGICRSGKEKEWSFVAGGTIRKTKNIQIKSDKEKLLKQQQQQSTTQHDNDTNEPSENKDPSKDEPEQKDDNFISLTQCTSSYLLKVVKEYLNVKENHGRLQSHKDKIISFFIEKRVSGRKMTAINGKQFIKKLSKYLNEKKLNGAIFQLFKAISNHKYEAKLNIEPVKSSQKKPNVSPQEQKAPIIKSSAAKATIFDNNKNVDDIVNINNNTNKVHIRYQQRNGRKGMTTIVGLPSNTNYQKLVKKMKKKWSSGGTLLKDDDENENIIKLNGDLRDEVKNYLVQLSIVDKSQIIKHGY